MVYTMEEHLCDRWERGSCRDLNVSGMLFWWSYERAVRKKVYAIKIKQYCMRADNISSMPHVGAYSNGTENLQ